MLDILQSPWLWVVLVLIGSTVQLLVGMGLGRRLWSRKGGAEHAAAREFLKEVQDLTARVNERVGQHRNQLGAIGQELRAAEASEAGLTHADLSKATEQLFDVNRDLEAELEAVRAELAQKTSQLESKMLEARTDALTGLVNRRAFDEELAKRFAQWQRYHVPLSVILLDVDYFKKFNDKHGHQAGDEVLRVVAAAFRDSMRDMDVVARYGGEEFVALMPATNLADAKLLIEQARQAIAAAIVSHGGQQLQVTASLGLSQAITGDTEAALLVSRADAALYAAKNGGRNQSWLHNGQKPEPVLAANVIGPVEVLESPAEKPAAKSAKEPNDSAIERRQHVRRDFRASHSIAPYVNGSMPSPAQFFEVFSLDISAAGFAFMTDEAPTFDSLIVEFGEPPNVIYLSARVVYCRPSNDPEMPSLKVGCRFTGRLHF